MPALTPAQRQQLQSWLTETGELYVDHYRPHGGGPSDNYFIDSVEDLEALITNEKWPELVVTIFRGLQFPIRGIADETLLARALKQIPEGKEFVIKNLTERYPSSCGCWGSGKSHAELRSDFSEIIGERVGIGQDPEVNYNGIWDGSKRSYWASHDQVMIIERKRHLYNYIGKNYAQTRLADPRITEKLVALLNLPPSSTILDVGAGTGKYSRALAEHGYQLIALEPSEVMQSQCLPHACVRFVQGSAESIPLPAYSAAGAIIVLALHHFTDLAAAFREITRVVGHGPIVLFTFDPAEFEKFWLADYFPDIGRRFSSSSDLSAIVTKIQRVTSRKVSVLDFPLPPDLQDKFGAASWAHPEAYLDPAIRNGISDFALMHSSAIEHGLKHLQDDLSSGQWDAKYGSLRTQPSYDVGYRFVFLNAKGVIRDSPRP